MYFKVKKSTISQSFIDLSNSLSKTNMSTSNSMYKNFKSLFSQSTDVEILKDTLRNFLSLIRSTEGLSTHFWTFYNVLQSSIIFSWKILQNLRKFQIILFLSRFSIYIIEHYTNLKIICQENLKNFKF